MDVLLRHLRSALILIVGVSIAMWSGLDLVLMDDPLRASLVVLAGGTIGGGALLGVFALRDRAGVSRAGTRWTLTIAGTLAGAGVMLGAALALWYH